MAVKKIRGLITLMSGVEYAVMMPEDWQENMNKNKFLDFYSIDGSNPIVFNSEGVLMVRPIDKEGFDRWISRQKELVALQERKISEAISGDPIDVL